MSSFRTKILISYVILFLVFIAALLPFGGWTVKRIVYDAMDARAREIISKLQTASNNQELVSQLRKLRPLIFHRVAIISDEHKILYDSHTRRLLGPKFTQEFVINHPEVKQAFETGTGYYEGYSDILAQKFAYLATAFDFHGKTYVMRSAFPYKYVEDLTRDFKLGFLGFSILVLLLFTILTALLMHHFSAPIQQIIHMVTPYQEGREAILPEIKLKHRPADDVTRLAATLNSLSAKVQKHIASLTRERNEKEAILESLIEGVVAVDEEMKVTYANKMALTLMGYTENELIGHPFSSPIQPKYAELLTTCQADGRLLTDTLQIKRDGKKYFLNVVAAPKGSHGAILVIQDQSSHYKMLEMRKEFVANASHELKTPITIIRGFAETLQDNPQLPPSTLKEITRKIVKSCEKMTSLIRNLLALSDVENMPRFRLIDCDLVELANTCRNTLLQTHVHANVQINAEDDKPFVLAADPELLELALNNLLDNAAKYSDPPAQITVGLSREGDHLKLTVVDKGIGIPAEDLENVFQRFYRVDKAHSRKMGGSGLGLSIVETIIDKHSGNISVQSTVGKGTTFTILLPGSICGISMS